MVASRHLTREQQGILDAALLKTLKLIEEESGGGLQDGMLAYYLSQAKLSDANVEARIEREPFDFKDHTRGMKRQAASAARRSHVNRGS